MDCLGLFGVSFIELYPGSGVCFITGLFKGVRRATGRAPPLYGSGWGKTGAGECVWGGVGLR